MTQVTKYIERFLCVLTPAAEIKVIQLDEVTAIDGTPVKSDQVGASSVTDPKVSALLDKVSAKTFADLTAERAALATMTADRDAQKTIADTVPGLQEQISGLTADKADLTSQVATLTTERDTLQSQADTIPGLQSHIEELTAAKAELEAEVARLTALVPPPVDPNAVPEFVSAHKGRIALKRAGLLEQVDQFVTRANGETQIFWEYAAEWHRNNAVLVALGASLNLTSEQIDDLFRLAGSI